MKLANILDPDLIVPNLSADLKLEAISEILDKVIAKYPRLDRGNIEHSILEREKIENTSYGRGFAFPHARTNAVDKMYIALGISHVGLEGKTNDKQQLHVICLMLTPSTISRSYLQTLSAFANFARTAGNTERLLAAQSPQEIIEVFNKSGVEVKRELTVADVMKREIVTVRADNTLRDVANLLFARRISGLVVIDESNRVVGVINNRDLIKAVLPDYQSLISSLASSYDSEYFEIILRAKENLRVGELMHSNVETVTEEASVVETAALMLFKDLRRIPVVQDGKLVGVVTMSDIISKVMRG